MPAKFVYNAVRNPEASKQKGARESIDRSADQGLAEARRRMKTRHAGCKRCGGVE